MAERLDFFPHGVPRLYDQALGAYLGLAVGDALLQGHRSQRPWDTVLIADAFVRWWRSKPVDCGNTCRRGIVRYVTNGSVEGPQQVGDGGNGALMRNLPVALAQAHITHHHPLSDAACVAFGQWLHAIWAEPHPEAALQRSRDLALAWTAAHPAFRFRPYPGRASGYVVDTVQTVLHHLFAADDFETAVVGAVNQGDDADTTGALIGMLAGAIHGAHAIPVRWLYRLDPAIRMAITEQTSALLALSEQPWARPSAEEPMQARA